MIVTIFHGCNQYQVSTLNILFPFAICKEKMKCVTCCYCCCFLYSSASPNLHRKKTSGKTVAAKDLDNEENDEKSDKDNAADDSKPKDIDDNRDDTDEQDDDGEDTDDEDDIQEIYGDDDDNSDIQEIGSVDPKPIGDDNDGDDNDDDDNSKTLSVDEVQAIDSDSHDNDECQQEEDDVDVMIDKIGDSGLIEDTGKDSDFVMTVDTGAGEYGNQKIVDYSLTESDNSPVLDDNG